MTSKFSIDNRELLQRISSGEAVVGINFGNLIVRELAAFRLAAMDNEPVAEITEDLGRLFVKIHHPTTLKAGDKLYRHAQPAPVVHEEITSASAPEVFEIAAEAERLGLRGTYASYAVGWNACRAAMLADAPQSPGSEPTTVPGKWIQVSEQMPPSRHEVLVGRWWGEKPRWCFKWATYIPGHPDAQSSGWLIPGASWTPTHWMPLPAAPQEVK
ncbi:TPA: DUF551 domain-containing protein [Klebsiella pneumoniae]